MTNEQRNKKCLHPENKTKISFDWHPSYKYALDNGWMKLFISKFITKKRNEMTKITLCVCVCVFLIFCGNSITTKERKRCIELVTTRMNWIIMMMMIIISLTDEKKISKTLTNMVITQYVTCFLYFNEWMNFTENFLPLHEHAFIWRCVRVCVCVCEFIIWNLFSVVVFSRIYIHIRQLSEKRMMKIWFHIFK